MAQKIIKGMKHIRRLNEKSGDNFGEFVEKFYTDNYYDIGLKKIGQIIKDLDNDELLLFKQMDYYSSSSVSEVGRNEYNDFLWEAQGFSEYKSARELESEIKQLSADLQDKMARLYKLYFNDDTFILRFGKGS
jgi:hypothetical protein